MIAHKKIAHMFVMVLALLLSSLSNAANNSGIQNINRILVDEDGLIRIWADNKWYNDWATICGSTEFIILLPEREGVVNNSYSEQYALIVASYLQNNKISGWLDGCQNLTGHYDSYPVLTTVNSFK